MKHFDGRVAAITGAASGIGRALALELARRGCHLALADVDDAGLAETELRAKRAGVDVTTRHLDVTDRDDVFAWADEVVADHGRANLVANNAGVALGASIATMSIEDHRWLIDIDYWGVVHGTQAFLPHLEAAGEGHVVNISSIFGLIGIPTQAAYNAAKFGVRGFTEALRMELDIAGSPVSATSVHPGGIKTNIARSARMGDLGEGGPDADTARADFEKLFITSPEKAALQIVQAVQLDKRRALIGPDAKAFALLAKLPPGVHQRLITAGTRRGF